MYRREEYVSKKVLRNLVVITFIVAFLTGNMAAQLYYSGWTLRETKRQERVKEEIQKRQIEKEDILARKAAIQSEYHSKIIELCEVSISCVSGNPSTNKNDLSNLIDKADKIKKDMSKYSEYGLFYESETNDINKIRGLLDELKKWSDNISNYGTIEWSTIGSFSKKRDDTLKELEKFREKYR